MVLSTSLGIVFVLLGLGLLWLSTFGSDWSNTHNRLLQRAPTVSARQAKYNRIVGLISGAAVLAAGIALLVLQPLHVG